jgi:HYR domain
MRMRRVVGLAALVAGCATSMALAAVPAGASEVDTATVDVTTPVDAVTLQPGTTNSLITINVQVTGNQDGTAGFDIYTDYDMHNGAFFATGAHSHFTVGPRAAQDPAFVTSVQGHLSVSPSEPIGVYPMSIFASNITNSNQTGAKLKVGTVSTYKVTVVPLTDVTPPSLFLPTDMHVSAQDSGGATVSYTATAHDNLDGIVPVNCSPASGSKFPIGTTSVNCSATDSHDNTANGSFNVVVSDTTAPVVTVPADITKEAAGPSGAQVTYIATASDAVDGMITPTCDTPSGSMFPLGTTTVTCSAHDAAGNTGGASFHVTVQDTTPPTLTLYNATVEATGPTTPTSFGASATDLVDGSVSVTCDHASGSAFPVGQTTVNCTATDAHGNTASGTLTVTVTDTTPPEITAPNITEEATGFTTSVSFGATATDLVDGNVAVSYDDNGPFSVGQHTVTATATDGHHNTATEHFTVTISDTTPPTITMPPNMSVKTTGNGQAVVTYQVSATDLVDGSVPVSCDHASGSAFGIGTTTVTCTATDAHGNKTTSSFKVTVSYNWTGFFQPIDNDKVNTAKAGQSIPVKFSLGGNQGLNVLAGTPSVVNGNTTGDTGTDDIETYTTSVPGLTYDASANQYVYVWKTDKAWAGTAKTLTVMLADGSVHQAAFAFTK